MGWKEHVPNQPIRGRRAGLGRTIQTHAAISYQGGSPYLHPLYQRNNLIRLPKHMGRTGERLPRTPRGKDEINPG